MNLKLVLADHGSERVVSLVGLAIEAHYSLPLLGEPGVLVLCEREPVRRQVVENRRVNARLL